MGRMGRCCCRWRERGGFNCYVELTSSELWIMKMSSGVRGNSKITIDGMMACIFRIYMYKTNGNLWMGTPVRVIRYIPRKLQGNDLAQPQCNDWRTQDSSSVCDTVFALDPYMLIHARVFLFR